MASAMRGILPDVHADLISEAEVCRLGIDAGEPSSGDDPAKESDGLHTASATPAQPYPSKQKAVLI